MRHAGLLLLTAGAAGLLLFLSGCAGQRLDSIYNSGYKAGAAAVEAERKWDCPLPGNVIRKTSYEEDRSLDLEAIPLPPAAAAEKPVTRAEASRPENTLQSAPKPEDSTPISLHGDDVDVRKALEMLSRQSEMNFVVSPGVTGKLTIDLRNKSAQETLDAILKSCNLVARLEKGIIYIGSAAESSHATGEQAIRVYHLNYVKAIDLEKMIKPFLSKRGAMSSTPQSETGIKGDAEKAGGDSLAGGEYLIVQDHEGVLTQIDRIVQNVDVRPTQVLIEAVIVAVRLDNGMDLGVNFALIDKTRSALTVLGTGAAINAAAGFTPAQVLTAGGKLAGDQYSGFAENEQGMKFGFVATDVTGFLRALESMGKVEVLATPRLLVLNKQRADLQLGDRLGYKTLTQTQTSTVEKVEFMDVGTQLHLRPFVSSDNVVRMEVHPERSTGDLKDGVPQTSSAEVTTNVMVPDGATLVIGGLMENEVQIEETGIPLLDRIPMLGLLFRHKVETKIKKELIVILTPRIWNPDCPAALNPNPESPHLTPLDF
jgi:general secretion pathway protein D